LVSIPPISGEDIVIKNFKDPLKNTNAKWITYLSATSVYGDHNGEWVNEKSETKPSTLNGKNRLKAENDWRVFSKENNLPLQIFRLSGIYSKQNNILKRLKTGQAKIIKKEKHFFSRIHVEDIANILFISLKKFKTNEIFNISDDQPASQEEVAVYGALLLKMNKPNPLKIEDLEEGMLKDFYKESKKVDNKKIKNFFNYQFIYPSYKEGLDNIVNDFI
jgi:nucleoside-diphosphate-sugar epimerase